jgi:translation initiation factor IF-2
VGIDELLDTVLTIAELHDFKSDSQRPATGTCLEAELHEGRGTVCKLLVRAGTLRVGDVVVCGSAFGRVKSMYDTLDANSTLQSAGPSTPVNVTGLSSTPGAGETFYVLKDIAQAREIAEAREESSRTRSLSSLGSHVTLENLFDRLDGAEVPTLNLILKSDAQGSIEAIRKEFTKLEHPEVKLNVLHQGVGGNTEGDVTLAHASDGIIIGFNVVPDEGARIAADEWGIQIRRYEVIYKLTEDLKAALSGMLKPERRQLDLGRALVQKAFHIGRVGTVAGCRVLSGSLLRNARMRVIRDSRIIGDYPVESLKREKDDAREVNEGYECGVKLSGFNDVKEGDILEAYKVEEVARSL